MLGTNISLYAGLRKIKYPRANSQVICLETNALVFLLFTSNFFYINEAYATVYLNDSEARDDI